MMNSARYVFVNDQGRVFGSYDDPTEEDFAYAAVGMVVIVRLADCCYYGRERAWRPVVKAMLDRAEIEGAGSPQFHVPCDEPGLEFEGIADDASVNTLNAPE